VNNFKTSSHLTSNDEDVENESTGLGINYSFRLSVIIGLSSIGMLLTSLSLPLYGILSGILLASLSSGLGETTFLQLSHYYNHDSSNIAIHGWSSGTGGAGLVGSGLILLLTTIFKLPINWVLISCAFFPFVNFWVYYGYLPSPTINSNRISNTNEENFQLLENNEILDFENTIDLSEIVTKTDINSKSAMYLLFQKISKYFYIYMLPLAFVYFAEYTINQGVAPTMLFSLDQTPFTTFRDSYVAYGTIYQIGVFISRSSGSFIKIRHIYFLGILQILNLSLCIIQSLFMIIPNIWIIFLLILYEGLLGGAAYVNTFMNVSEEVNTSEREFALGCVGISDSFGIVLAATISLWLEPKLCNYQVDTGRNWCTLN
jgi:battenin